MVSRIGSSGAFTFEAALIRAYLGALDQGVYTGSIDEYIELFKGRTDPKQDLIEYLHEDVSIRYDEMSEERSRVSEASIGELLDDWKKRKKRRPWVDETAFETLVFHDVKAFLLIENLRAEQIANSPYSHKWWWLVLDGSAFHFDRSRRQTGGGRVCMSPDFFARFVSLAPRPPDTSPDSVELLPVCLEAAELGYIPPELRERAVDAYERSAGQPEYLRRRLLRELVNEALAEPDQAVASDEVDEVG